MRLPTRLSVSIALSVFVFAPLAVAQEPTSPNRKANRETPLVLAVRKVKPCIATLRIQRAKSNRESVGTGVVIDERGYVLTNRHVVTGAEAIKILVAEQTLEGDIDFEDASYDLAVVKIRSTRRFSALSLGPASDLMVGEEVIAIGHPFGYTNSVSRGIVSALDREVDIGGVKLQKLIQTTASINPGNSGGPLLNINGELIGINVALREGAQGIAFALHADRVQELLSRRLSASRRSGVYHGLDCRELVQSEGERRSLVVVEEVAEDTPSAAAGLKEGDQILRLNYLPITNRFDLERSLWDAQAGEQVALTVRRSGRELNLQMSLPREATTIGGIRKTSFRP